MEHTSEAANATIALAQTMVPLDPAMLFQQGPLVGLIGVLLWYIVRQQERFDQLLAAERALNAQLQEKRLEDQKVLIPLGSSMVAATEQGHEIMKRMLDK